MIKNATKAIIVTTMALSITACASHPDKITVASISTIQYQGHNCKQIGMELDRVNNKIISLYNSLDKKAGTDSAQMAVGLVLFWPALFFLEGGDGAEAAEYSKLKGELNALERVAIKKKCGIDFPAPPTKKKSVSTNKKTMND